MIAIGIVAHIDRQHQAEQLAEQVRADIISIDGVHRRLGCNANHRRTWTELAALKPTVGVVLEDDAVPCPDFRHQLELAIKATPTHITSLYLGRQRPPQWQPTITKATHTADTTDAHYLLATHLLHAVGVAITYEHIQPMLTFTTTRNHLPFDEAIGAYARNTHQPIAYLWPSIIDHRDGTSIAHHRDKQPRTPGRTAWRIGTRHHWDTERTATL